MSKFPLECEIAVTDFDPVYIVSFSNTSPVLSPLSLSSSESKPDTPVSASSTVNVESSSIYPVSSAGTGSVVEDETVKVN